MWSWSLFGAAGHQMKVPLLTASLNLTEMICSIQDLIVHFTLKAVWKEGRVLKDFSVDMKCGEQWGGRLILIWSVFAKWLVSQRTTRIMLMRSTADTFRNDELAGLISKHTLTQFKGMFDQAVCKTPVRVFLLLLVSRCLFYSMFVIDICHLEDCEGLKTVPDYGFNVRHISTVSSLTSVSTADAGKSLCFHTNFSLEIENDFIKQGDILYIDSGTSSQTAKKHPHSHASHPPPWHSFPTVQAHF